MKVSFAALSIALSNSSSIISAVAASPSEYRPTAATIHGKQLVGASNVPIHPVPPVDIPARTQEDKERAAQGLPPRFAIPNEVMITPQADGEWESIDKGAVVWRYRVKAPGAKSLNLGFTRFKMPVRGTLFIYSSDQKSIVRPFTSEDNNCK